MSGLLRSVSRRRERMVGPAGFACLGESFHRSFPIYPDPSNHNATLMTTYRTGFALISLIWTQRSIRVQAISRKRHTWTRLNTRGVRLIQGNATCITMLRTVSSLLAAHLTFSHFPLLA